MPSNAQRVMHEPLPASRGALVALLVKVLHPLVLLMLKQGFTAYEFGEIARWTFAQVAMDRGRFAVRGRKVWSMTKSRAAVLTGLTRREVDRLVTTREPAVDEARANFHRSARILTAWMQEDGYQDLNGRPLDLPVKGPHGSLDWLVRRYCRDIPIRTMLDELEDRGCVERLDGERVRFLHGEVGGQPLPADLLDELGRQAGSFMTLVEAALSGGRTAPHFLELSAMPIAAEHRDALRARIVDAVETFAAQVNRDLSSHPKSLLADDGGRMVVGFYNGFI